MPFEIIKGKDNKFFFRLQTEIGLVVLTGKPHPTKEEVEADIQFIIENAALKNFERGLTSEQRKFFVIKNKSGKIIAKSDFYWGIRGVKLAIQATIKSIKQAALVPA